MPNQAYTLLESIEIVGAPLRSLLAAELLSLLQNAVLPLLSLAHLLAVSHTCWALRQLVREAPGSAHVYKASARQSGLPLSHPLFEAQWPCHVRRRISQAATTHAALLATPHATRRWTPRCAARRRPRVFQLNSALLQA